MADPVIHPDPINPMPIPSHAPPLGDGPGEHHVPFNPSFDPSPGIGTAAASPIPAPEPEHVIRDRLIMPDKATADKAKADKAQLDKEIAEKEKADREHGDKLLGDMDAGIHDKLTKIRDEFGDEFTKLHSAYIDMPDEIKAHALYKPMGEKIASLEALLNTLNHTAASFPVPVARLKEGVEPVMAQQVMNPIHRSEVGMTPSPDAPNVVPIGPAPVPTTMPVSASPIGMTPSPDAPKVVMAPAPFETAPVQAPIRPVGTPNDAPRI